MRAREPGGAEARRTSLVLPVQRARVMVMHWPAVQRATILSLSLSHSLLFSRSLLHRVGVLWAGEEIAEIIPRDGLPCLSAKWNE